MGYNRDYYEDDYYRKPTLKEEVEYLSKKLEEIDGSEGKKKKKDKPFKVPFRGKVGTSKIKKNWITCVIVNDNHNIDFVKKQIKDNTVMINDVPYIATPDHVLLYKKKPMIIIESQLLRKK